MSTNNSTDSTSDNNSYFLRQQGLIYDEIDWPQPSSSTSTSRTKNITSSSHHQGAPYSPSNNVVNAAWRTRDPLTNLLGTDASIIQSETGLTNIELSLLDGGNNNNESNNEEGGHNQHTAESQFAASQVNIQSNILGPLLPNTNDDDDDDRQQQQLKKINVEVVKLAFDAASYAILTSEQKQRASILCSTSAATTSAARAQNNVIPTSPSLSNHPSTTTTIATATPTYDPPLVLAMESIRTSRISNLREASNVGSLAIPQFLKKNATIPWFHLPCAVGGTTTTNTTFTTTTNTNNGVNAAVVAANVAEKKKKKKGGPSIVEGKEGDKGGKNNVIIIKKRPVSSGEEVGDDFLVKPDSAKRIKLMQQQEGGGDAANPC